MDDFDFESWFGGFDTGDVGSYGGFDLSSLGDNFGFDLSGINLGDLGLGSLDLGGLNFDIGGLDLNDLGSLISQDVGSIDSVLGGGGEGALSELYSVPGTNIDVSPFLTPEDMVNLPSEMTSFEYGYPEDVSKFIPETTYTEELTKFTPRDVDVLSGYVPNAVDAETEKDRLAEEYWKQTLGTGTAVPGGGTITTNSQGQTVIKYNDGSEKVIPGGSSNTIQDLSNLLKAATSKDNAMLMAMLGGLLGLLSKGSAPKGPVGYKGSIPKYTATRGQAVSPTEGGRRPGGAGIPSLTGGVTYQRAAQGGLMGMAEGGRAARYLRGTTDGMADKIQTDIDGKQPARLSHGEFVIPSDVVSHLGNGNSDAGADVLYDMMDKIRKARTGTTKQGKQINPRQYTPA